MTSHRVGPVLQTPLPAAPGACLRGPTQGSPRRGCRAGGGRCPPPPLRWGTSPTFATARESPGAPGKILQVEEPRERVCLSGALALWMGVGVASAPPLSLLPWGQHSVLWPFSGDSGAGRAKIRPLGGLSADPWRG